MDFGGRIGSPHIGDGHLANANFAPANEREWTNFGSGDRTLPRISHEPNKIRGDAEVGERVDPMNTTAQSARALNNSAARAFCAFPGRRRPSGYRNADPQKCT